MSALPLLAEPLAESARAAAPITVYGAGYIGLVMAACLAELGHSVTCIDGDAVRVSQLGRGRLPFFEPGLEDLLVRNVRRGRLLFRTVDEAAMADGAVHVIAISAPCGWDGASDMREPLATARQIGRRLQRDAVLVCRGTWPVGSAERIGQAAQQALMARPDARHLKVSVVANPELLQEGSAVDDFMQPDRVIVGADDDWALQAMHALYAPLLKRPGQWLPMSLRAAELTRYACNAMLAARISVINDLALLAERLHVDIDEVRRGLAGDPRIGAALLTAGCGFGGSSLPTDLRTLRHTAMEHGVTLPTLAGVEQANERQQQLLAARAIELFGGSLTGRRIALWGLAFKPGTDDLCDAPSETTIAALTAAGAQVVAHDPVAMPAAQRRHANLPALTFAGDPLAALDGADALIIATDWPLYQCTDWPAVRRRMASPNVLDGRNICDPERMAELGFEYQGVGRGRVEKFAVMVSTPPGERPLQSAQGASAALGRIHHRPAPHRA